ncbi:unnamed protein product [Phytophthora fragariaefolia]|uniref:Unnamed protein product n=1 Tax=Phytophthora fragariaefolia TaxID=1490495 RepID=A0A9W6YMZ4_9STRA|nr:unnamed protein product [Phytophthora fragariaefolia]
MNAFESLGLSESEIVSLNSDYDQMQFSQLIDRIQPDMNKLVLTMATHHYQFEIASYINVNCSYAELLTLFHTSDRQQHIANMKALFILHHKSKPLSSRGVLKQDYQEIAIGFTWKIIVIHLMDSLL